MDTESGHIRFKCNSCHEEHVGAPSFSFDAPLQYSSLSDIDKKKSITSTDLCVVLDEGFFIRVVLKIPIIGHTEPFLWGVWVSQSKENFQFYFEHFTEDLSERKTFGWLANNIPTYEDTLNLKTEVHFDSNGQRPHLILENTEHELSRDFHEGITLDKAMSIVEKVMHP